jgi:hypothetical protein
MSAGNLLPDGTVAPDSSVVTGAATAHQATNDSSDASYVNKTAGANPVRFTLQNPTKPANGILRKVSLQIKASSQSSARVYWDVWGTYDGRTRFGQTQFSLTGTTATSFFGGNVVIGDLTQSQLNALEIHAQVPSFSAGNGRLHEVWLYYEIAEPPTVNVDGPVGTQTISDVLITWTHTPGAQGDLQSVYVLRVFSEAQYTAQGFNPDTSPATWEQINPSQNSYATATGLSTNTYRAYVKTAQNINSTSQYSAWDYIEFDVLLTTAEVDTISVQEDNDLARLEIVVDRLTGDAWSGVELQRNFDYAIFDIGQFATGSGGIGDGWTVLNSAGTPTSLQASGGKPGQYQRFAATLDTGDKRSLETSDYYTASPFIATRVFGYVKGTLGAGCELNVVVNFYDALYTYISSVWESVPVTGSFLPFHCDFYSPAGSRYMKVAVEMNGVSATAAACTIDVDSIYPTHGGYGWAEVPYTAGITPGTDQIVYYDYDVPPDRPTRYRARAIKSGNIVGAWVYDESPHSFWTMTSGVWIKSLTDFRKNLNLRLHVAPDIDYPQRRGEFEILGDATPVVVSDVRSARGLPFHFLTETTTEMAMVKALAAEDIVLIQPAPLYNIDSGYWSLGPLKEKRPLRIAQSVYRVWEADQALEARSP